MHTEFWYEISENTHSRFMSETAQDLVDLIN